MTTPQTISRDDVVAFIEQIESDIKKGWTANVFELKLAKLVLEAMDSKPTEYKVISPNGEITLRDQESEARMYQGMAGWKVTPLYTIPPAAVSQPVMFIDGDISSSDAEKLMAVIEEFRHSGEPTNMFIPNSPVIPDGWIKCSDRLPDPDIYVQASNGVWVGIGRYSDSEYLESDEHWQDEHGEFIDLIHFPVTHWMPLPTPPAPEA